MLCKLLAGLVLIHGLFTTPLLVVCHCPDGKALIEIIGHDPCHGHGEVLPDAGDADLRMEAWHEPCLDPFPDKPALVQPQDNLPPASSSTDHDICPLYASIHMEFECRDRSIAWHPLIFPIDARSLDIPIRI